MLKKFVVVATVVALAFSLVGCANKPVTPPPTTQTPVDQSQQSKPPETAVQPGGTVKQADVEAKINDLLTKKYPGDWKVAGTTLSKGAYTENNNYKIVDEVETLFPGTMGVSIFVGEDRISSSVKQGTERVLKGYATPPTVGEVMKSGKTTSTDSSGYFKIYLPLKAGDKTLAVLTVSVPQQ